MERFVGTVVRGIRTPIVHRGDDVVELVVESVLRASEAERFCVRNRDVVGITESLVARAQGNYASVDDIAGDIRAKFGSGSIGVVFPILSRNRYAMLLKGVARGARQVVIQLSYPADEVGNHLVELDELDRHGVNPWEDQLDEQQFKELFGSPRHAFTGMDYVAYYRSLVEGEGAACTLLFSNRPTAILDQTRRVLACDIHTRARTKAQLEVAGADLVHTLDDILSTPVNGSGFNPEYGLLGSNKATEETVKLFPRDCQDVVNRTQERFLEKTGRSVEVLVYGDGAFKDPVGKIWELADPVVSPAYTRGLEGTPNEVKIKFLADNHFADLSGEELRQAIAGHIQAKQPDLTGAMEAQGTTPRRLTDLIGSQFDLTSGSGDKGTPVIHIQGYFDNYASTGVVDEA